MENCILTTLLNKKTISVYDLIALQEELKNNPTKLNTDKFIKLCEKLLLKNVRLFLSLTSEIETFKNQTKNKKQKLQLQAFLIYSHMLKHELNFALGLFLQYEKELNILPAIKNKLQLNIINILLEFEQYDKANYYLNDMISSKIFSSLKEEDQVSIILKLAFVLQSADKPQINLDTKNEKIVQLILDINEVYFKITTNLKNKKQLNIALNNYKLYCQSQNKIKELVENTSLNLPIILLLIENNNITFATKMLNILLKSKFKTAFETIKIYEVLLPILKHSNISLYLNAVDEYFALSSQYKQQNIKIVKNSFTQTTLANDLQTSYDLLKKNSLTDQLTGCLNRKALDSVEINFKRDYGALIYFDLNNLKPINDKFGHMIGDEYLVSFANILLGFVNEDISVYRVGGDEFILIANNHTKEKTISLINKISKQSTRNVLIKNRPFIISFSAGISLYPTHSTNLNTLINLSDKAMYKNKTIEKSNCYVFAKDKIEKNNLNCIVSANNNANEDNNDNII